MGKPTNKNTLKRKVEAYNSESSDSDNNDNDTKDMDLLVNDNFIDSDHDYSDTEPAEIPREKREQVKKDLLAVTSEKLLKMSGVMQKILASTNPKTKNAEARPILSEKAHIEIEIDDEKLAAKAKKALSAEKKAKTSTGCILPSPETMDYEKKLKKLATHGGTVLLDLVVQLFNALRAAQKTASEIEGKAAAAAGILKLKLAPLASKKVFLDSLQNGTSLPLPTTSNPSFMDQPTTTSSRPKMDHWDDNEEEDVEIF